MEPDGQSFHTSNTSSMGGNRLRNTPSSSMHSNNTRLPSSRSSRNNNNNNNNNIHYNNSSNSSTGSFMNQFYYEDDIPEDYVHVNVVVPETRRSTMSHRTTTKTSAAAAAAAAAANTAVAAVPQEEQRPPTLALDEDNDEEIYNSIPSRGKNRSRGSNGSSSSSALNFQPTTTKSRTNGVVSKMFFWKRNNNNNATPTKERNTSGGGGGGSSIGGSLHNGTTTSNNTMLSLPDATSIIRIMPPTTTTTTTTKARTISPKPQQQGRTANNVISRRSTMDNSKRYDYNNNSDVTKAVKVKPTKVPLSSLLQSPPSTNSTSSSNSAAANTVSSIMTVPPVTTIIPTTTLSSSTTNHRQYYNNTTSYNSPQQKSRNHLPPSKAMSMIQLSNGTTRNQPSSPPKTTRTVQRDPPTLSETAPPVLDRNKHNTVIGLVTPSLPPPTTTTTSNTMERRPSPSDPYTHLPESPTNSQYSSKNSITTMNSSSTTAIIKKHPPSNHNNNATTTTTNTTGKTPLLSSYQTNTPITKHYNISQQILHAFEMYYTSATTATAVSSSPSQQQQQQQQRQQDSKNNDDDNDEDEVEDDNAFFIVTAFTIGVQYVETVLIEIPKHGYYYSKKHCKERLQSCINALHVGHLLLHLLENNNNNSTTATSMNKTMTNPNPTPSLPYVLATNKEKERNRIQNLIGIAMTHIEQVTNSVCGSGGSNGSGVDGNNTSTTKTNTSSKPTKASSSSSSTSTSWLEQQYNNSVSILSLSTVCCGHDLTESPISSNTTATSTNSAVTALNPTMVASIIPILQGAQQRPSSPESTKHRNHSNKANDPPPQQQKPLDSRVFSSSLSAASSSSSVFYRQDPPERDLVSTPGRYISRENTLSSLNSHQSATKTTPEEALMLEKALFLSGLEVSSNHSNSKMNHHNHHYPPIDLLDISTTSSRWGYSDTGKRLSITSLKLSDQNNNNQYGDDSYNSSGQIDTMTGSNIGSSSLELATLAQLYHEDFDSLQQSGRVRISYADTYQGRYNESTNGCTVIAPLICIHHLINTGNSSGSTSNHGSNNNINCCDPGLTDSEIVMIIDQEAPSVLSELRQSLGLAQHAFLIPADVHDYLLDQGQLASSQFINVAGGNILNDEHLQAFISILEKASLSSCSKNNQQKIGATLFFHEHVLAICKLHRTDSSGTPTRSWYDIIDSLPNPATLRRCNESSEMNVYHRIGMFNNVKVQECMMNHMIPKTARIRCLDVDALCAVLKWYACSKFTTENISYIDQYPWDEQTCDFDPRVFQAFIWGSCTDDDV